MQPDLAMVRDSINERLGRYEMFLETTNADEEDLLNRFSDKKTSQSYMSEAYGFGDLVFQILTSTGRGNRFHRLLVV